MKNKITIQNKKAYQLTHLLEHSHLLRNGTKSTPISHIYPVEQKSIKEFEKGNRSDLVEKTQKEKRL